MSSHSRTVQAHQQRHHWVNTHISVVCVCVCVVQATSLRHPFIVPCVESWVVQHHTVNMIYAFCQNGDLAGYLAKVRKQVRATATTH